ncbi:MAG TPA: flagellar filament capping protein FliD [Burkholderiaceae bacterium]|nr:flagellar filament capping protein FliD [Burkholderiaceae bacterium]
MISSAGVGSGLDVQSIVSQLMKIEQQPLNQLKTTASSLQTKLSAYGTVKSGLSGLQDAATKLLDTTIWKSKTFLSSNTAAVTGSASAGALATSFGLKVNDLAQVQSTRSVGIATGSQIGSSGRLDIQLGQWSGTSFAAGTGSAVSVNVAATDTLADIATKINSGNAGVTAVVVKSGSNDQLLLRGNTTGAASGFQVRSFDGGGTEITDGTTGVGKLAYAYSVSNSAFFGMTQTQAAQDANVEIDGITVTSATNTVANAVPGITLNLLAKTTTAATITVGDDTAAIKSRVEAFQTAFNKLANTMTDLTKYDTASKKAGALQGDATAVGLQNVLRNMLGATGPSGTSFNRLSDIGLEMQRDGTLSINNTKLDAALKNLPDLNTFFTASTGSSATDGMARRINSFIQQANGVDGNVSGRSKALQASITRNSKDQDALNQRLAQRQAAMYAQYNALDKKMGSLSSMSSFVSQQIAQWNK